MPLSYLLLINCLILTCLQGKLEYKTYSSRVLLLLIVEYCVQVDISDWRRSIDEAQKIHELTWVNLMKGMEKRGINVRSCYQSLPQALNKAQGSSQDVRFIDAALALDIIEDFERKKWVLIPVESNGTIASPVWSIAYDVYDTFLNILTRLFLKSATVLRNLYVSLKSHRHFRSQGSIPGYQPMDRTDETVTEEHTDWNQNQV